MQDMTKESEKINDVMQIASWILCKLWKLMSHLNYKH
jgi:hypothetical protein